MLDDNCDRDQPAGVVEDDCANVNHIIYLLTDTDAHTGDMMPGWSIELACQKLLFFTRPADFPLTLSKLISRLDNLFDSSDLHVKTGFITFLLNITESLHSTVELRHNLMNSQLHGDAVIKESELSECIDKSVSSLLNWESRDPDAARIALDNIMIEDLAVNKGDNMFAEWAQRWSADHGTKPYSSIKEYLDCFKVLYSPQNYYISLFHAWDNGTAKTQFFNDYGIHAARCRRIGSLGGTTNPAIAVMGEDDLDAKGNTRGESAVASIRSKPNKWRELRKRIAKQQIDINESDEWGASAFTEWVVTDAMLALRPIFLLTGLGRVAYQLRPDWHLDEEKLIYTAGHVYDLLSERVGKFDDILLQNAGEPYTNICAPRIGKPNNHFKIACTSQVALNVVKALNAGHHPLYHDALKERMFTNMTLVYDVSQMVASSLAIEEGLAEYRRRTGKITDDGQGGSAVASMIGRFNDAIRNCRVNELLGMLTDDSPFRSIDPSSIKSLDAPPMNTHEFKIQMANAGITFDPALEEDAIDHAGTLTTKRAVIYLENVCKVPHARILTASKRNFDQNTDLLGVAYSTDFGNIQRMSLDLSIPCEDLVCRQTIYDGMNLDGTPASGSIWERRSNTLARIWNDWEKAFDPDGVCPEEYLDTIYVPPTLKQFTDFWFENVARAKSYRESAESDND